MPRKSKNNRSHPYRRSAAGMGAAPNWGPATAPVAVSRNRSQETTFSRGSKPGSLVMHTNAAICRILKETTSATTGAALNFPGGVGISCELNLTHPLRLGVGGTAALDGFITPIFDLIASAFVRYRLKRLAFHYEPQAAATDAEQMVFAFAADPVHPVLWNSTIPTADSMLALADSRAFMPWEPWTMDVTSRVDTKTIMYTYSDPATTVGTFSERFSDFGVISCTGAKLSQGAVASGGVLYMETEIELMEFCPISVTRPAAAKHVVKLLSGPSFEKEGGRPSVEAASSSGIVVAVDEKDDQDGEKESCRGCEVLANVKGHHMCPDCGEYIHGYS